MNRLHILRPRGDGAMAAACRDRALARDERGHGFVEYLIVLAVVALGGFGLWQAFGQQIADGTNDAARALDGVATPGVRGGPGQAVATVRGEAPDIDWEAVEDHIYGDEAYQTASSGGGPNEMSDVAVLGNANYPGGVPEQRGEEGLVDTVVDFFVGAANGIRDFDWETDAPDSVADLVVGAAQGVWHELGFGTEDRATTSD